MSKKQKPDFLNLKWSESDDQLLKDMIAKGANGTTIANALGRTRSSVFNRKYILGIEGKIKRSPKGSAGMLTYSENTKRTEPQVSEVNSEATEIKVSKPKTKKSQPKAQTEIKVERGKLSQTAKLAQINRRLRRGDIRKVAEKVGFTEGFVSAVLSGSHPNERIINVAYSMVRGRKTNEQMMKKK